MGFAVRGPLHLVWVSCVQMPGLNTNSGCFSAALARMVPPTPTEKAMRRRLAEMRALQEELP